MTESYFQVTDRWRAAYPDAHAGILIMENVANPAHQADLQARKEALEADLRARYTDKSEIAAHPIIEAYNAYYKRFEKSYHVRMQLESIVFKGKSLPNVAALVEAMFMAEISDHLLTAGHDLDSLQLPVTLDAASGDETYTPLRGEDVICKAGDMLMRDQAGVISSIIYGPDRRTPITAETRNVLFAVYAPAGVGSERVREHLDTIRENVLIVSPDAQSVMRAVFGAD